MIPVDLAINKMIENLGVEVRNSGNLRGVSFIFLKGHVKDPGSMEPVLENSVKGQ